MNMEVKFIEVSADTRKKLAKMKCVNLPTVSKSLNFKSDSRMAAGIRDLAMQLGGKLVKREIKDEVIATEARTVKVLDSKGNVKAISNQ